MAKSCSSSTDEQMNPSINSPTNNYWIILQNSGEILDEILEIQQIEYEQRLIQEEIIRIDREKKRLQDLLNLLRSTKVNTKRKNIKRLSHRLQSSDSESTDDDSN